MTRFDIQRFPFTGEAITDWAELDPRYRNWPVVYTLESDQRIYVGETLNAEGRLRQHLESPDKQSLQTARVVIDDSFNKSVCLDLESNLIRLLSGDGTREVLNRNAGITDANYFGRAEYRDRFQSLFELLRAQGLFSRSIPEIENSDLFKLSPFKGLTHDQAIAVDQILESLFSDLETEIGSSSVIQGDPGTGKTVVGIYLMKLLRDIADYNFSEPVGEDELFGELFTPENVTRAGTLRVGLVISMQSLRESVRKVFKKTPGLDASQVLSPFEVGEAREHFDVLIVDEAHRLSQRANQSSAALNRKFSDINIALFGTDDVKFTQLDWIVAKSTHQIFLLDTAQSVKPGDLPIQLTTELIRRAKKDERWYKLLSQMRLRAAEDYVGYVRNVLGHEQSRVESFSNYDLRLFESMSDLYAELAAKEVEFGLCRLVAGYAWKWQSKNHPDLADVFVDGMQFPWNSTTRDWVNSEKAFGEVGSIHTVQGYDLNYAGVIVGPDIRLNPESGQIEVDRANYFDTKGKENNPKLGQVYSDEDLLKFVTNIYAVLMTRGIRGTFVYCVDPHLRAYLKKFFPVA